MLERLLSAGELTVSGAELSPRPDAGRAQSPVAVLEGQGLGLEASGPTRNSPRLSELLRDRKIS